jgi:putative peptidoglycan lipid II flippase
MDNSGRRLAVNASIVMGATLLSRATGFFREMLIPAKFGVGFVADVYDVAFKFPDLMFNLLIGGAISAALVPVLSGSVSRGKEGEGWQAISRFINLTMALTLVVCVLGTIFSEKLVTLFAQGWDPASPEDALKIAMAAKLMRTLFPSVAFLMLAGFANSVLYSYQRFSSAAFGPVVYNILCIASIAFLSGGGPENYYRVDRVVYGVMFSSFVYFVFQTAWALRNIRGNYAPSFDFRHRGFRRLFKIALPSLASSSAAHMNAMVSTSFSSRFADGSIAAMRMADRTWQMPFGIIAQSIGIALLPNLSGKHANGDREGYRDSLRSGLRYVLMMSIPVCAACVTLSGLIMRTLFMNSPRITDANIALSASILTCFSGALITQSACTILVRAFYAVNETLTPMLTGISIIGLNIALSLIFQRFTGFGASGMALAYVISSLANMILLVCLLNRKLPGLNVLGGLRAFFVKTGGAAAAMSAVLAAAGHIIPAGLLSGPFSAALKVRQIAALGANAAVGAAVYFGLLLLFRLPEAMDLSEGIKTFIMKRLGRAKNESGDI